MSIPPYSGLPTTYYPCTDLWPIQKIIAENPQQTPYQGYRRVLNIVEGRLGKNDISTVISCLVRMGLSTSLSMREDLTDEFNRLFENNGLAVKLAFDINKYESIAASRMDNHLCLFNKKTGILLFTFPNKY